VGRLISLGGIVFFEYEIRAGSFQKDFYKVRAVRVIIDDQNPSFSFGAEPATASSGGESVPATRGKKSAANNFFTIYQSVWTSGKSSRAEPSHEPCSQQAHEHAD
jgi:hypothetical protein